MLIDFRNREEGRVREGGREGEKEGEKEGRNGGRKGGREGRGNTDQLPPICAPTGDQRTHNLRMCLTRN